MSPNGHHLTSLCFGTVGANFLLGDHQFTDIGDFSSAIFNFLLEGEQMTAPAIILALSFFVGVLVGSRSPDWLEISFFINDKNKRVIKHRTLTHSPWLWLFVIFISSMFATDYPVMSLFGIGWAAGSILHILIDMGSPTGIPLGSPFGKRFSYYLYSTNKLSELYLIMPILAATAGYFYLY